MKTATATFAKTLISSILKSVKSPVVCSLKLALNILLHQYWRRKLNQANQPHRLTADEIETYVWGFVVVVVTLILAGIVFALLYSVTFVVQPIKSMAPIDIAYTKMLNDIVLLVVGGIGGVMSKKGVQAAAQVIAPKSEPKGDTTPPKPNDPSGALPVWVNPELDETWVPPPPPTTPPEHLESEDVRAEIAAARAGER